MKRRQVKQATESFLTAGSLLPKDPNPAKQIVKLLGGLKDDVEYTVQMLKRFAEYPMFQIQVAEHLHNVLRGTVRTNAKGEVIPDPRGSIGGAEKTSSKVMKTSQEEDRGTGVPDEAGYDEDDEETEGDEDQDSDMTTALRVAELVDCKGLVHVKRLLRSEHPEMKAAGEIVWTLVEQFREQPEGDAAEEHEKS